MSDQLEFERGMSIQIKWPGDPTYEIVENLGEFLVVKLKSDNGHPVTRYIHADSELIQVVQEYSPNNETSSTESLPAGPAPASSRLIQEGSNVPTRTGQRGMIETRDVNPHDPAGEERKGEQLPQDTAMNAYAERYDATRHCNDDETGEREGDADSKENNASVSNFLPCHLISTRMMPKKGLKSQGDVRIPEVKHPSI
jgi:hypothetical protein